MAGPLRVAVLGAGYFAQFHYDAWRRIADARLVGCADLDAAKAAAAARRHEVPATFQSLTEMLDAVATDVVDIAVPPPGHLPAIRAAAARGIDVICQKPFCQSLAEAEEAVAVAAAAGIRVIVHENFRFQPWYRKAREVLDSGTLGEVFEIAFRMRPGDGQGPAAYLSRQPYFQTMPRFLVHETAIHFIDTFRFLMGEVTAVYADLRRLNPVIAGEDAGVVLFDFASGARGLFDGNRLVDHRARDRRFTIGEMTIEGARATLALDGDGALAVRAHGSNAPRVIDLGWTNAGFAGDSVRSTQAAAVAGLMGRAPIENAARDYLVNLAIEDAIYRSSAAQQKIAITPGGT